MKRVYFEDGVIIECTRQCVLHRQIKKTIQCFEPMRYWFRPTKQWEEAVKQYNINILL